MNYTNNRNNRRCVSRTYTEANNKQSKVFDNEIKRDNITATAASTNNTKTKGNKNIVTTTRDKSCIQTILDSLDGYYNNDDDERVQVVNESPPSTIRPPIHNLSFSSLNTQLQLQIPKEIMKKKSSSPPPRVPSNPKHSNMKKGLPRRRHSLPDNAKLPNSAKLNRTPQSQKPAVESSHIKSSTQPVKQPPRRRRHTLSGNTAERPDISCIQSFIRQSNIHEEDYYHHQPNKLAVVKTNDNEFERVDQTQTHSRILEIDHKQSSTSNNNNKQKKSQVKRIIERRRRHSMPDNMRAPNVSDLLMSLPLPSTNTHHKGLDKRVTAKRLDHTTLSPSPDNNKNEHEKNENKEKYRYEVGQTLQDATSHSLQFTSNSQATKLLSQLPLNTPLFVKRTSNQQWQAQWSYCMLVKHIYNESNLIGVEVSLTDIQEGKDKKGSSRVRTKVIEVRYFERWLMMVNFKTVLVQESTATHITSASTADNDDDQTDMATRGSESNQVNEDRPPRMIFQGYKEDVNSSIYSSSSSSSSSSGGASSSNDFYSVISSTESFSSSSMYSSCSSDSSSYLYDAGNAGHDIPGRYLDFNSPVPLPKDDDDVSTTSARSSYCSSGASDQVLIASKSARLLRASL